MNWLRKLMYGRYGADQLGMFLLVLTLVLTVLSYFTPVPWLLSFVPLALYFFRMFSRDIQKRQRENYKFMTFWYKLKNGAKNFFTRLKTSRDYKYFRCPNCRQTVRVPRGKGKINITCPKCNDKFQRKT